MNTFNRLFRNKGVTISLVALVLSGVALMTLARTLPTVRHDLDPALLGIGALWFVGVPLWFLIEWAWFDGQGSTEIDNFKYTQGLARQLWLSVAAVLAFLIGLDLNNPNDSPGTASPAIENSESKN